MTRFFASVLIVLTTTVAHSQDKTITVFASSSMIDALHDVDLTFTTRTGIKVVTSYDASSMLIKQIEGGAPADVFVSSDVKWMDYGVEKKVINESTRINLFGNVLVLIAAKNSKIDHVDIKPGFDLAKLAGDGRIATGDVKESGGGDRERQAGDDPISGVSALCDGQSVFRGLRLLGAGKAHILNQRCAKASRTYVRYWHKADIATAPNDVRFRG